MLYPLPELLYLSPLHFLRINDRLKLLLTNREHRKFLFIGHGLQILVGQTSLAKQDKDNSIPADQSEALVNAVHRTVNEVSTGASKPKIRATKCNIYITPCNSETCNNTLDAELLQVNKKQGLEWMDDKLGLELALGPNLICGDSEYDLPMVEAAMHACPDRTQCIFVTKDPILKQKVMDLCPATLVVRCPDTLMAILWQTAKRRTPISPDRA